MAAATDPVPQTFDGLTAEWLTHALRRGGALAENQHVLRVQADVIGDDRGFVGQVARLRLEYDQPSDAAPHSLIAKLPAASPEDRGAAEALGLYDREVLYYQELAASVPMRSPRCYFSHRDPGPSDATVDRLLWWLERMPGWVLTLWLGLMSRGAQSGGRRFVLLLEDLGEQTTQQSQLRGADFEHAAAAVRALAHAQAPHWNTDALKAHRWLRPQRATRRMSYLATRNALPVFRRVFASHLSAHSLELAEWLARHGLRLAIALDQRPESFCHGDFRLDNLFFERGEGPLRMVTIDWQTSFRGLPTYDLAYFISGSLPDATTEQDVERLLAIYHQELRAAGVESYELEALRRDYQRALLFVLQWAMTMAETVEQRKSRDLETLMQTWARRLDQRLTGLRPDSLLGD
jgi:hypothetical protein